MAKQDLTQKFKTEGAEEAARKIQSLEEAQKAYRLEAEKGARLMVQPGASAKQIAAQKTAVDKAAVSVRKLGGDVSATSLDFSGLAAVASALSPRLGIIAQVMQGVARSAGDLGEMELAALFRTFTKSAGEYAGALKLLGAGGAAFAGITLMAKSWEMTKEAVGSATEKLEKFEEQNRRILDQNKDFDQRFAGAVAGGAVAPGDEKSRAKKKSKFDGLVSQGVPEDLAFDISTGQKGLSKSQKDFFESNSFRGQRGQIAEDLERGTLTTDQIEAIAKQLNLETEDVEARVKDARTLIGGGEIEAGLFADFKDFLSGADKGAELEAEAREVLGAVGKASVTLERDRESGADFNKLGIGTVMNEGIDATRELAAFVKEAGADLVEGAKMSLESSRKVAALMERGAKSSSEAADRTARQVVQIAPTQPADLAETT